jgi:hypothetical protein
MGNLVYRLFGVAVVLGLFWFLRRDYFWPVALVSVLVTVGVLLRARFERRVPSGLLRTVAQVLGVRVGGRDRFTVLVAEQELGLRERDGAECPGGLPCLELSLDLGGVWPFCFVLRPESSPGFGAPLGANHPIAGADFEYTLEPLLGVEGLEAATNLTGLLQEFLGEATRDNLRALSSRAYPILVQVEFSGSVLRSLWQLGGRPERHSLRRVFARFVLLGVDLKDLITRVRFKNKW